MRLNWSKVKRSILIGPKFAIRTANMDRLRTEFTDLCSWKEIQKKTFDVK